MRTGFGRPSNEGVTDKSSAAEGPTRNRAVRILTSAPGAALATLTGYIFGAWSFYTNFFDTVLQATAALVDTTVVVILIVVVAARPMRDAVLAANRRRVVSGVMLGLLLVAGVNYIGLRPPGVLPAPKDETCIYDVHSKNGVPIPLEKGGSLTQQLRPLADKINSISPIIGLDETTARTDRPHPIKVVVRTKNRTLVAAKREDIVNNTFSRFEFREPIKVKEKEILVITVTNESEDPLGFYVKQPDLTDLAAGAVGAVFVEGHVDNEAAYQKADHVMSGCITRPGSR